MVEAEILRLNKEAMDELRGDNKSSALSLLTKAQELLKSIDPESQVWGITFNNLGCYFKKTEDFPTSLIYIQKALEILEKKPSDILSISGALLNLSSIHSEMKNHEKALKSALKAHKVLSSSAEKSENIWTSLVITYHSIALEYENLGRRSETLEYYKTGWEFAKEKLGKNHKLTLCLKKSLNSILNYKAGSQIETAKFKKLQFRSNSSNANSRVKFPNVKRRMVTPVKDNYKNIKHVEKSTMKTLNVPDSQVSALSSLVKEIEKTLDYRPKKYVFKKKSDSSELIEYEGKDKYLPIIKKYTPGFNMTSDTPASRNLQTIPEMVYEGDADSKNVTRNKTLKRDLVEINNDYV